jgi:hypothetical protein
MASKVTGDPALRSTLKDLREPLEMCDEAGRTVGHFLPTEVYEHLSGEWAKLKYPLAELERRQQETGGRTTKEVLACLRTPRGALE